MQVATAQLAMEFKRKEDEMKIRHEGEISELKQELFALSVKVHMSLSVGRDGGV